MEETSMEEDSNNFSNRNLKLNTPINLEYEDSIQAKLEYAYANGADKFTIFFTPTETNSFPKKPVLLKKNLDSAVTSPNLIASCTHTRQGKLAIQTSDIDTAIELSNLNNLLDIEAKCEIYLENICSRFLLHDIPIDLNLSDLASELYYNDFIVQNIRRFTKKGSLTPTETCLITIYGTSIPEELKLFYTVVHPSTFYDRPRQCSKCYKYNHSVKNCSSTTPICIRCGEDHPSTSCSNNVLHCVNCKGDHSADHQQCPSRIEEARFLKFKIDSHLTFSEARRKFKTSSDKNSHLYATVTKTDRTPNLVDIKNFVKEAIKEVVSNFDTKLNALAERQEIFFEKIAAILERGTPSTSPVLTTPNSPSRKKIRTSENNDNTKDSPPIVQQSNEINNQPNTSSPTPLYTPTGSILANQNINKNSNVTLSIGEKVETTKRNTSKSGKKNNKT